MTTLREQNLPRFNEMMATRLPNLTPDEIKRMDVALDDAQVPAEMRDTPEKRFALYRLQFFISFVTTTVIEDERQDRIKELIGKLMNAQEN